LVDLTTGHNSTAIGAYSLQRVTTGRNNSGYGYASGGKLTTGDENTCVGMQSGYFAGSISSGDNTSGDKGVFIGYRATPSADGNTNEIVIGSECVGLGSNTVTLGNDSIVTTALKGNVGIGTDSPTELLHLKTTTGVSVDIGMEENGQMWRIRKNQSADRFHIGYSSDLAAFTDHLTIHKTGELGIGYTVPTARLHVNAPSSNTSPIFQLDDNGTAKFVVDDEGKVGIGTDSPADYLRLGQTLATYSTSYGGMSVTSGSNAINNGVIIDLNKRPAAGLTLSAGEDIGQVSFRGWDGSALQNAARILAQVDSGTGASDMPGRLIFKTTTNGTTSLVERMRIDSVGRVGMGTTPDARLHVNAPSSNTIPIFQLDDNGTAKFVVDDEGKVGIGTDSPADHLRLEQRLVVTSDSDNSDGMVLINRSTNLSHSPFFDITRHPSDDSLVTNGSVVGTINFRAYDGTAQRNVAAILAEMDGGTAAGDMPGRIIFKTATDGTTALAERMRIINNGKVGMGDSFAPSARLHVNAPSSNTANIFQLDDNGTELISVDSSGNMDFVEDNLRIDFQGQRFIHNFSHPTGDTAVPYGNNVFIGQNCGNTTTGSTATSQSQASNNVGVGRDVLVDLTTGQYSTGLGAYSLRRITTGRYNTGCGFSSGGKLTTGHENTCVGMQSGYYAGSISSGDNTSGDRGVFVGYRAVPSADGNTNEIVIGSECVGLGSNTVSLGNDSIVTTALKGKVGIGTDSPDYGLDVVSTSGFLRLGSSETDATQKFSRFVTPHYLNAEQPFLGMMCVSNAGLNRVSIGGGSSLVNTATEIQFYTATNTTTTTGTERMRIDTHGKIGIGTSPDARLHVNAPSSNTIPIFQLDDNGTAKFVVGEAGNVGIRCESSGYELQVHDSTDVTGDTRIHMTTASSGGGLGQGFEFILNGSTNAQKFNLLHRENADMGLWTNSTERMTIKADGKIGIGDTSPDARLHVNAPSSNTDNILQLDDNGTAKFVVDDEGKVGIGTDSPDYGLDVVSSLGAVSFSDNKTDATVKLVRLVMPHYRIAEAPVSLIHSNSYNGTNLVSIGGGTTLANAATELRFLTAANSTTAAGTLRMTINSAGYVGLGPVTPNYFLDAVVNFPPLAYP